MTSTRLSLQEALKLVKPQKCFVYRISVPNNDGQSYIGITTLSPDEALSMQLEAAQGESMQAVHKELRKYGMIYDFEILSEHPNEILGIVSKIAAIKKFNTLNDGLNSTIGGEGNHYRVVEGKNTLGEDVFFVENKAAVKAAKNELRRYDPHRLEKVLMKVNHRYNVILERLLSSRTKSRFVDKYHTGLLGEHLMYPRSLDIKPPYAQTSPIFPNGYLPPQRGHFFSTDRISEPDLAAKLSSAEDLEDRKTIIFQSGITAGKPVFTSLEERHAANTLAVGKNFREQIIKYIQKKKEKIRIGAEVASGLGELAKQAEVEHQNAKKFRENYINENGIQIFNVVKRWERNPSFKLVKRTIEVDTSFDDGGFIASKKKLEAINPAPTGESITIIIRTQNKPFSNDEAAKGWLKEFPFFLEGLNIQWNNRVFILPIEGLLGVKFKIFRPK